jgi:protein-disulfide isomerase
MMAALTATLTAALLGLAACGDTAPAAAEGTDATSQDLLTAAGAVDAPTGSLPPGAPRNLLAAPPQETQTVDIALLGVDNGSKDAPVRVVEFSDYGCGYCRKFHLETYPLLDKDFIGAGKVEWKFLPYVSGMFKNSPTATLAAECVLEQDPSLFPSMNNQIWDQQSVWKGASDPAPVVRGFAQAAKADMARWDACMSDGQRARRVEAATALARQLGVRATPTFFVVGYPPLQGALPPDVFQQVLTMVYEEATKTGGDR